ncbi:MAG TPA: ATP-grasp fold amidoligase family protein [Sphingopyxis sp.]|nr:ATP-grasp fold amidoligase family protein [Sphingopyxis sp.]
MLHDHDWRQLVAASESTPPPPSLAAMLEAAEALAGDMAFVRIDFYDIAGKPYFGEFCFIPVRASIHLRPTGSMSNWAASG